MKRNLMTQFIQWKKSKVKSPILLLGTRQVGKTFLIKEFGETSFKNFVYLNFENSPNYNMLFEKDLNTVRIIEEIELELEQTIHPENTLIILDEIQQAPKAITALKYFKEDLPQYHIVCAGSLLGIMLLREQVSFPVGKVDFKYLYPFTFDEFLIGLGHDLYVEKIKSCFDKNEQMPEVLHSKLIGLYKHYLCIGGMPASINNYRHHNNSLTQFDCNIHENIINAYIADMGKYTTGSDTLIAQVIYLSLPSQLAKENKKFKYSIVKKGSKSAHYDAAIEWLLSSRMNLICNCINYPDFPLSAYTEHSILKLYMNDVGLLNSMGKIPYKVI
jgi:predicted AAA+ superfamily ATPase